MPFQIPKILLPILLCIDGIIGCLGIVIVTIACAMDSITNSNISIKIGNIGGKMVIVAGLGVFCILFLGFAGALFNELMVILFG